MSLSEHESEISDENEEHEDRRDSKNNRKNSLACIILGVILIAVGGFFILFKFINGGGKAEEAFTLLAWVIGAPALLIGSLILIAGFRKGR